MEPRASATFLRRLQRLGGAALLLCGLQVLALPALAADADRQFATVLRLRGEVKATSGSTERALREGDKVYTGDKVAASGTGEAVLKTVDSGMVAVRPGAQVVVQEYSAKGDASDSLALRLLTGSLRLISGWIGSTSRANVKVHTPVATIGIRGTDHEPFVLPADLATAGSATPYRAGTYDKVNRGGTTLSAGDQDLAIDPGRVGFVRGTTQPHRTRAMMTLLLPVLLEKVPDFYVPGEFDAELDRYSQVADSVALADLAQKRQAPAPTPLPATGGAAGMTDAAPALPPSAMPARVLPATGKCAPLATAKAWLAILDEAIKGKDAATILGLFAHDVAIKAIVRNKDGGLTEVDISRDEMVKSTLNTVAQLEGYAHRRISTEAKLASGTQAAGCRRLEVKSVVVEQGRLSGQPFRFESIENFVLERRDGKWLATRSESTQR